MFAVGIAKLATSLDEEAPLLARDLGSTPYETRLVLAAGLPAIVLVAADKSRALEVLGSIRGRGHEGLAFDTSAVVASGAMFSPRRFHFEADAMIADAPEVQRLAYGQVAALLRASHQIRIERTTQHKEKKFSAGRALLTGGLVMTKTRETTETTRTEHRQQVLYIFRKGGAPPWLLREEGTRYDGLGDKMAATEHANFLVTVELLRGLAPAAAYDDRLVTRKVPERIAQAEDLIAHLLAMWLVKRA